MKTLYHYTCAHQVEAIRADGFIRPCIDIVPFDRRKLVPMSGFFGWFTDLTEPDASALGLTAASLSCDRTAFRFTVTDASDVRWWMVARLELVPELRALLEGAPGAAPAHWFLSRRAVPVLEGS